MSAARIFYVITTQGQHGPFDHAGLREALRAGQIAAGDQVRTGMGSPRGTVSQVLRDGSDRLRRSTSVGAPVAEVRSGSLLRGPVPIIILCLFGAVTAVLMLSGGGAAPAPIPTPAVVPAPTPARAPVVDRSEPVRPVEVPKIRLDLLPGRPASDWLTGGGAQVRRGEGDHAWIIGLPGPGNWVCSNLDANRRNLDLGSGLALEFAEGSNGTPMTVELIEPSGERFLADFVLPPVGQRVVLVPWSAFKRRDWQPHGATSNGLQRTCIASIGLWQADQLAHVIKLVAIGVY